MTVEQYTAFIELLPDIEQTLKSKGFNVPRPRFDKTASLDNGEDGGDGEEEDVAGADESGDSPSEHKGKLDKFKMKKNHEATSDEEE